MKGRLLWPVWPGPTYAGHIYGKMKKWKQLSAGKGLSSGSACCRPGLPLHFIHQGLHGRFVRQGGVQGKKTLAETGNRPALRHKRPPGLVPPAARALSVDVQKAQVFAQIGRAHV